LVPADLKVRAYVPVGPLGSREPAAGGPTFKSGVIPRSPIPDP